jgi:hypothetical protein
MVELGVRLANELVVATRSAGREPENESDVAVVEHPHGVRVAQKGVDVGSVEERSASIVEGDRETLLGLAAEDGEDGWVQVALFKSQNEK